MGLKQKQQHIGRDVQVEIDQAVEQQSRRQRRWRRHEPRAKNGLARPRSFGALLEIKSRERPARTNLPGGPFRQAVRYSRCARGPLRSRRRQSHSAGIRDHCTESRALNGVIEENMCRAAKHGARRVRDTSPIRRVDNRSIAVPAPSQAIRANAAKATAPSQLSAAPPDLSENVPEREYGDFESEADDSAARAGKNDGADRNDGQQTRQRNMSRRNPRKIISARPTGSVSSTNPAK